MPSVVLPQMRLPAPATLPPIVLAIAPTMDTPIALAKATVPDVSMPMSLPATVFPAASAPARKTPAPVLLAMMFSAVGRRKSCRRSYFQSHYRRY